MCHTVSGVSRWAHVDTCSPLSRYPSIRRMWPVRRRVRITSSLRMALAEGCVSQSVAVCVCPLLTPPSRNYAVNISTDVGYQVSATRVDFVRSFFGSSIKPRVTLTLPADALKMFNSCQGQEIILLSTASRPALGSTQPPVQWVPGGCFLESSSAGAWSWPLTSIECRD
jgi:hypothetical protein